MAAVGTLLWTIEVFVITKEWINIDRKALRRKASMDEKEFNESASEPEARGDKYTSQDHVINHDIPQLELESVLRDCNDHLVELKIMNQNESPSEPEL